MKTQPAFCLCLGGSRRVSLVKNNNLRYSYILRQCPKRVALASELATLLSWYVQSVLLQNEEGVGVGVKTRQKVFRYCNNFNKVCLTSNIARVRIAMAISSHLETAFTWHWETSSITSHIPTSVWKSCVNPGSLLNYVSLLMDTKPHKNVFLCARVTCFCFLQAIMDQLQEAG